MASPAPLTRPTRTAEAPSDASNGPVTERAPSYTMSAARLTTPNPTTARHGDHKSRTVLGLADATSVMELAALLLVFSSFQRPRWGAVGGGR